MAMRSTWSNDQAHERRTMNERTMRVVNERDSGRTHPNVVNENDERGERGSGRNVVERQAERTVQAERSGRCDAMR